MGIPFFLLPDVFQKHIQDARKAKMAQRLSECVDWNPKMPWKKEMNLKASSYSCLNLFPELTPREAVPPDPNTAKAEERADSPSGVWRYTVNTLPRGGMLRTWCGSKLGTVLFDGPVRVPAIYRKWRGGEEYAEDPWMSLTPAEILSMQAGLRFAKGRTVVAGLGLGYLLINVTKKKSVKKVTLVEISQELVDWLLPKIKPHLGMDVDVIVGDANTVIPGLEADSALIDIDSTYGNNTFLAPHQHIDRVWVWGSAKIGERNDCF